MNKCRICNSEFRCGCSEGKSHCWCGELPHVLEADPEAECVCLACLSQKIKDRLVENPGQAKTYMAPKPQKRESTGAFAEGLDYYINESGYWVFTEYYHLKKGYCCQNGCKHCPYGYKKQSL